MDTSRRFRIATLLLLLLVGRPALAADEAVDSAVWLLRKATLVHQNGMHNILLRAMRQMHDPDLKPLFSELVQKHHPALRIHGILGLAEIDQAGQVDLALLADIQDPATQVQLVTSALEAKLLTLEQAKQIVNWPKLDAAVKVIVAAWLLSEKALDKAPPFLDEALSSDNEALRGVAALIKLQLGDAAAAAHLDRIHTLDDPARDNIRGMVLQTAMRYRFESIAPWATKLASEQPRNPAIGFMALRAGIFFGDPEAARIWAGRFQGSTGAADRIRLAILALDLAEKLDASLFDLLIADEQPIVQQMGRVGRELAAGQSGQEQITALLSMNHVLAAQWAIQYCDEKPVERAQPILVAMIRAAEGEPNDARFRAQRLEHAVLAAQQLAERMPDARSVMRSLFVESPSLTQEAMLMGLIRTEAKAQPHLIAEGINWPNDSAAYLALLLKAKHGVKLEPAEIEQLKLIVRGGAGLQEPLRVQAAWIYLKLTNQDKFALASVLGQ